MNHIVKFLTDEDGFKEQNKSWHYVVNQDANRALCNGQVFGFGESKVEYKDKLVERGGITCSECIKLIKEFKSIKL